MNHSGDAAEQIVRLSLEGVEVAARITGTAAKEIATFIVAALKSDNKHLKLKGKARMATMLKSGKALEIYSVKESDLQQFMQGAKQYGIVYCVLRNTKNSPDGLCDIMVKADDAPKISRMAERFRFATVDRAKIENEIMRSRAERTQGAEPEAPDRNDTEKLHDGLLSITEGKAMAEKQPEPNKPDVANTTPVKETPTNPAMAKTKKSLPSAPTLENKSKSAKGTSSKQPSVRNEIKEINAARQAKKEAEATTHEDKTVANRLKANPATTHKQPQTGGKSKRAR